MKKNLQKQLPLQAQTAPHSISIWRKIISNFFKSNVIFLENILEISVILKKKFENPKTRQLFNACKSRYLELSFENYKIHLGDSLSNIEKWKHSFENTHPNWSFLYY